MANERTCLVCGSHYQFCPRCRGGQNAPTWKNIYDTEDCKKIFEICSAYVNKRLDKADAAAQLKNVSVPALIEKYQKIVDEITYVEKPAAIVKPAASVVVAPTVKRRKPRTRVVKDDL